MEKFANPDYGTTLVIWIQSLKCSHLCKKKNPFRDIHIHSTCPSFLWCAPWMISLSNTSYKDLSVLRSSCVHRALLHAQFELFGHVKLQKYPLRPVGQQINKFLFILEPILLQLFGFHWSQCLVSSSVESSSSSVPGAFHSYCRHHLCSLTLCKVKNCGVCCNNRSF